LFFNYKLDALKYRKSQVQMRVLTTLLIIFFTCAPALSAESQAVKTEQQGLFGGSLGDAIWTVLAFGLLVLVLRKVAWKQVLEMLKTREQHIQHQIESAEESRRLAEKMLEDSRQQGVRIIKDATEKALQHEHELTERARQEVLEMRRRAKGDIEHASDTATEQLWEQAGEIVLSLGKEVLGRNITDEDNKKLIRDAVAKLKQ
jgi:F-type H+-transporting ATPase subunit b